jgi:hypothetical protein
MSLVDAGIIPWPYVLPPSSSGYTLNGTASELNGSGYRVATNFRIPAEANGKVISTIGWRSGTVTQLTNALRVGLYTVSSSHPTSTPYGGSAYATVTPVVSNTFYSTSLPTGATCTAGDLASIVWEFDNYAASDTLYIANSGSTAFPVSWRYTSSWSGSYNANVFSLAFSDGMYFRGLWTSPPGGITSNSLNSGAITDIGNQFTMPFKCRVRGIYVGCASASAGTFNGKIYTGGTVGSTVGSLAASGTADSGTDVYGLANYIQYVPLTSPLTVAAGTVVTATFAETAGAAGSAIYSWTMAAANEVAAYGRPLGFQQVTITGGTPIFTATSMATVGLLIDQLETGVAGSGGVGSLVGGGLIS